MKAIDVQVPEIKWDWSHPYVRVGGFSRENVDPFPGYRHDPALVKKHAVKVRRAFPLDRPVTFYLPDREVESRLNGQCSAEHDYQGEKIEGEYPIKFWSITLSGKRIPLHPGMTRYLVAHEYGHAVEDWICQRRRVKETALRDEYRTRRRLPATDYYGGGSWHLNAGEVFANDFRILVCDTEPEFWPHPGIIHPKKCRAAKDWWRQALKLLKEE